MKSTAHQYEDKLLEFAYGELPQHEADAVDAHVRGCHRCSQSLLEIRGVRATMAQLPMEAAPDAGLESLLAYAEQAARRGVAKPAPSLWKRILMPLASVAALATVGVVGFRANEEFDTSPAAVMAQAKIEDRAQAEGKAQYEPQNQPTAPAPVAAVTPSMEPLEEERANKVLAAKDGKKNLAQGDLREAVGGQRGEVWSPEPKKEAPQSATRRSAKLDPIGNNDQQQYRDNDYSNAAQRGGLPKGSVNEAPPPPAPPPAQDKAGGFGLGSGLTTGSSGPGRSPPSTPAPVVKAPEEKQKAEAKRAKIEDERPADPAPAPVAAAPMPSSTSSAPSTKKPAPKSGYGIRPQLGDMGSLAAESDDAALEKTDSLRVDQDAKFAQRQAAESRTRSLESARVASSRGDRVSEIRLLAQVLQGGAVGYERVEALKRICDAYEAMGEVERADPFCDQLVVEFPNTAAARAVGDRRKRMQRAPAPAKSRSSAEQKSDLEETSKPKPAEAAPAQAY